MPRKKYVDLAIAGGILRACFFAPPAFFPESGIPCRT